MPRDRTTELPSPGLSSAPAGQIVAAMKIRFPMPEEAFIAAKLLDMTIGVSGEYSWGLWDHNYSNPAVPSASTRSALTP